MGRTALLCLVMLLSVSAEALARHAAPGADWGPLHARGREARLVDTMTADAKALFEVR